MSDTLESIAKAAVAWRVTRKHQGWGERLPKALKRRAVGLLGKHTARELAQVLRVSDPRLVEGWRARLGAARRQDYAVARVEPERALPAFVEVALPPAHFTADLSTQAAEVQVELCGGQGCILRLHGRLDAALIRSLAELAVHQAGVRP